MAVEHVGEQLVREAEAAGIPAPFWAIEGTIESLDGSTAEISLQLRDKPTEDVVQQVRAAAVAQLRGPAIQDGLSVALYYDPREWRGGRDRRRR